VLVPNPATIIIDMLNVIIVFIIVFVINAIEVVIPILTQIFAETSWFCTIQCFIFVRFQILV
jgi:hypothetical protein